MSFKVVLLHDLSWVLMGILPFSNSYWFKVQVEISRGEDEF